jgi:uncharacterized protein with FMN-binding domain
MSKNQPKRAFSPIRILQKFAVSAFVICSFLAYAVHERVANPDGAASAVDRAPSAMAQPLAPTPDTAQTAPTLAPAPAASTPAPAQPTPTAPPPPTAVARTAGAYKDGTYTGPQIDAQWGWVRVQAIIQNGKLTNVRFLEYPNDRRTSVAINRQVMPWLQTEAVQAQNANVDLITGATLTSEAFVQSLQGALNAAKNQS